MFELSCRARLSLEEVQRVEVLVTLVSALLHSSQSLMVLMKGMVGVYVGQESSGISRSLFGELPSSQGVAAAAIHHACSTHVLVCYSVDSPPWRRNWACCLLSP